MISDTCSVIQGLCDPTKQKFTRTESCPSSVHPFGVKPGDTVHERDEEQGDHKWSEELYVRNPYKLLWEPNQNKYQSPKGNPSANKNLSKHGPLCLCSSASDHLWKIHGEVVQYARPPESHQQHNKPQSLQIRFGIVKPCPIPPHAEPYKKDSKGFNYAQYLPKDILPVR